MSVMQYGQSTIIDDLSSLELGAPTAAGAAVYDQPIGTRLLFRDPKTGAEHYLIRYPARLRAQVHRHTAAHTILVVEGHMDASCGLLE
jgi:hypothetical protein